MNFSDGTYNTQTGVFTSNGLIADLGIGQQLELIYIAYFNRAADGPGSTYWAGQNLSAQNGGENASTALTGIADAFTPQPETITLYPFLGQSGINLSSPAGQAGLTAFISSLYKNMFGHAPDAPGAAYWLGQLSGDAVAMGAAALAIANGATGSDAIEVQNKIAVASNFTSRTAAVGLGASSPLASSFLTAAKGVLSSVDGISLNDASVTTGMNATTAFINGSSAGDQTIATVGAADPTTDSIQFLAGADETLFLRPGTVDQVTGFDPRVDALDLSALLSAANINLNGDITALEKYVAVTDQGRNATINFDPTGHGGGSPIAVLIGLGTTVTSLGSLISDGAIRVA